MKIPKLVINRKTVLIALSAAAVVLLCAELFRSYITVVIVKPEPAFQSATGFYDKNITAILGEKLSVISDRRGPRVDLIGIGKKLDAVGNIARKSGPLFPVLKRRYGRNASLKMENTSGGWMMVLTMKGAGPETVKREKWKGEETLTIAAGHITGYYGIRKRVEVVKAK